MCEEQRIVDDFECAAAPLFGGLGPVVGLQQLDEANPRIEIVRGDSSPSLENDNGASMVSV